MFLDILTTAPARYFHNITIQEQILIQLSLIIIFLSPEVRPSAQQRIALDICRFHFSSPVYFLSSLQPSLLWIHHRYRMQELGQKKERFMVRRTLRGPDPTPRQAGQYISRQYLRLTIISFRTLRLTFNSDIMYQASTTTHN